MDLSDLTIVITSRNRPEKLIRVVNHLETFGFKGKLFIQSILTRFLGIAN